MRKKQDTNLNKNVEDFKFEIMADDLLIYETLTRRKIT
jgi:hypothetical protein